MSRSRKQGDPSCVEAGEHPTKEEKALQGACESVRTTFLWLWHLVVIKVVGIFLNYLFFH